MKKIGRPALPPEEHVRHCKVCGVLIQPGVNGWRYVSGRDKGKPVNICRECSAKTDYMKRMRNMPIEDLTALAETSMRRLTMQIMVLQERGVQL